MKFVVSIFVLMLLVASCKKEEYCISMTSSFYDHKVYVDTNQASPHFQDTVLRFQCGFDAKTFYGDCLKCCPGPSCLGTKYFKAINLTNDAVELKLNLAGIGERSFVIAKKDTLNIDPLPDYCQAKSWGSVTNLSYK